LEKWKIFVGAFVVVEKRVAAGLMLHTIELFNRFEWRIFVFIIEKKKKTEVFNKLVFYYEFYEKN